jgi:hypothetical protein
MPRLTALAPLCALALALAGCHPRSPLPPRTDAGTQKLIDDAWDKAMTPPDKLARAELLDVLVGTQAYLHGVDVFALRAEKRFAGGRAVMEIAFDRSQPDDDRFEVTVLDDTGKRLRHERFTLDEVEEAYAALCVPPPEKGDAPDQLGTAARRAEYEARWKKIIEVFPQSK